MTRCRRERTDDGLTLVELLITVGIMGIAFVTLIGGMGAGFVGAATHRRQALAETYIRQYAEEMKAAPYASSYVVPSGTAALMTASAVPNAFAADAPVVQATTCQSAGNCTQVLVLTVRSTGAAQAVTETVRIVKRS